MLDLRAIEDQWVTDSSTVSTMLDEKATRLIAVAMRLEAYTLRDAAKEAELPDENAAMNERAHTLEQLTRHILGRPVRLVVPDTGDIEDELETESED